MMNNIKDTPKLGGIYFSDKDCDTYMKQCYIFLQHKSQLSITIDFDTTDKYKESDSNG